MPVSPFVVITHPAPPVCASTTAYCLAGQSPESNADFRRRLPRLLLGPHSPSTAFETRDRPDRAPDTTPAAAEVPALVMLLVVQVTSLSGSTRRDRGCVRGSGDLVSHLHRGNDLGDPGNYRFSVYRLSPELQATHELHAFDLHDLVKLCQVLAFAIIDDGWIPRETRDSLRALCDELDALTRRWSDTDDG